MQEKKKIGIISGKFRVLHNGHKEAIIRATLEDIDKLYIFIQDTKDIKRYSSINELKLSINAILKEVDIDFEIIIFNNTFSQDDNDILKWEDFIKDIVGQDDNIIIFNSKEEYKNISIPNKFLDCSWNNQNTIISASTIENNPLDVNNYQHIASEFMPFINKKVVISGVESSGKTQFSVKLSQIYNTVFSKEYGRDYAKTYLYGDDNAFTPKDFVHIATSQMQQDRMMNRQANRFLIVDTDPIVTMRFLKSYYKHYEKLGILDDNFIKEYNSAYKLLDEICKSYKADYIFVLAPNTKYVQDGTRWDNQSQVEREIHFNELISLYKQYNLNYIIIDDNSFNQKFNKIEKYLNF